jgi:serine/threonine protein kinase
MALVTELMPKGNLHTLLHDPKCELSLYRRLQMARDTALGMNWLHCSSPQIIHRDLKPSNLLLDEHLCVKVCDFGLSAVKNPGDKLQDKGGIPGTPLWMAPEVRLSAQSESFRLSVWCNVLKCGVQERTRQRDRGEKEKTYQRGIPVKRKRGEGRGGKNHEREQERERESVCVCVCV